MFLIVFRLLSFAEVEKIDRTSRFRLTHHSIQRALDAGQSGEEIVKLLQRHMRRGDPLPQLVEYSIREWSTEMKKTEAVSQRYSLEHYDHSQIASDLVA